MGSFKLLNEQINHPIVLFYAVPGKIEKNFAR